MPEIIASYQTSAFAVPVNGTPDDADQVRGNDNTLRAALNSHDGDGGVHFQSSPIAARPAAGSLGRKWLASDTGRVYFDDGSNWQEIGYVPTAGGVALTLSSLVVTGAITCGAFVHAAGALTIDNNGTLSSITLNAGATLNLNGQDLALKTAGVTRWTVNAAGHLLGPAAENLDIGTLGATRPRAIFAAAGIDAGTTFSIASLVVVRTRQTGYTNPWTGTLNRATAYDASTVTLVQLAQRVAALQADLTTHGLIGP